MVKVKNRLLLLLSAKIMMALACPVVSAETLLGSETDDIIIGTANSDILKGDNGNDFLEGGNGSDELQGGSGDDILIGGPGKDRLQGGPGADQFVFDLNALEIDEILDFSPEEGDSVIINLSAQKSNRSKIPTKLTIDNITLDHKGDIKIRLQDKSWFHFIRLKRTDLSLKIQQRKHKVYLGFSSRL